MRNFRFALHFPALALKPLGIMGEMTAVFGAQPNEARHGRNLLRAFDSDDALWAENETAHGLPQKHVGPYAPLPQLRLSSRSV